MHLEVKHDTAYSFDHPVAYGLQRLRLTPISGPTQRVLEWDLTFDGCEEQLSYHDYLGNEITLVRIDDAAEHVNVTAEGVVETLRTDGIIGPHRLMLPLWYFQRPTELTTPGKGVKAIADRVTSFDDPVERMHALSWEVLQAVSYRLGDTGAATTAEEAIEAGSGVCQDHTHIFVAAARRLGAPARYVSGYLLLDDRVEQSASHAWAEVHIDGLGWVGFDISNSISADERYVRVAVGRDYREAAPVAGIRRGEGHEDMNVTLAIAQQSSQAAQ